MIVGVGIDLCEVGRLEAALERNPRLRDRLFTAREGERAGASLAARFAAKEALSKALGAPPGLSWRDAEVVCDEDGRPSFEVSGTVARAVRRAGVTDIHLSLTHDAGLAAAYVVLERRSPGRWRKGPDQ